MKFVHIADIHFDAPFTSLKGKKDLIEERKLEQRKVFNKVIEYIKKEKINYLFIAGDLYENEYVKKSTIDYINNLFESILETKIFITPGNHDPNIKGSFYDTYEFAKNVKIFKNKNIENFNDDNIEIYGFGFNDFYMENNLIDNFQLEQSNKFQILIMHGDLNGVKDNNGVSYNPISEKLLNSSNFDYIAMGHIHKSNFKDNKKIVYPGSLISLGFDEIGNHGMIVGEFNNKKLNLEFIELDNRKFTEIELDVINMYSQNDIIEAINTIYIEKNNLCKIILKGERKFLINKKDISRFIDNENIIKIKDETKLGYNLEEISKEKSLRGLFIKNLLEKYNTGLYTEEEIKNAIEIGLESME